MAILRAVSLNDVHAARDRLVGIVRRTPLVRLDHDDPSVEIYLKLENLQPIGSFKIRGAANAMRAADPATLRSGVYTASAGNMAQGVAYCARQLGIPCSVIVPDRAPATKLDALARLGARVVKVSFDRWWQTMVEHSFPGESGVFVHPFEDPLVMAGNGTIALEILEELPDVDAVMVPWGGGGLACGIAAALRSARPGVRVQPVEVETATPLAASFAAGRATSITPSPSFVDGMGGKSVFESMWRLAQELLEPPVSVSVAQIAAGIRLLAERARIVAEGASAAPVAAALGAGTRPANARRIACVVSGGNIDRATLATVLRNEIP